MHKPDYDLCVIGGGINGAGIARDAAGRGLSVLLLEAGDLAGATSSASTKLIHGGLRYLEYYEFRLVRHSLKEREVLMDLAPHIIRPMTFVLPHDKAQRPAWMIRAGLFLYDHLAGRQRLHSTRRVNLRAHKIGKPLKDHYKTAFCYADCWAEDARLVVLNAMDAAARGADIRPRTACTGLAFEEGAWRVKLQNIASGSEEEIIAAAVVNAAGPWVRKVLEDFDLADAAVPKVRLVKGSHIIVRRRFEGPQAYILQQPDRRIVFAIPFENDFTLIGTTEEAYEGDPYAAVISDSEIQYLCDAFNRSFVQQISKSDILWTYSGVRPLFDDGQGNATEATRDYHSHHHKQFSAPLISVFGGKLTTYRVLAEEVMEMLGHAMKRRLSRPWTALKPLPGGNIEGGDFKQFVQQKSMRYPFVPEDLMLRYARAYGTRLEYILNNATSLQDLGRHFGDGVYEAEIDYLVRHEWAREIDDILWRRSKLGLHIGADTVTALKLALPSFVKRNKT